MWRRRRSHSSVFTIDLYLHIVAASHVNIIPTIMFTPSCRDINQMELQFGLFLVFAVFRRSRVNGSQGCLYYVLIVNARLCQLDLIHGFANQREILLLDI